MTITHRSIDAPAGEEDPRMPNPKKSPSTACSSTTLRPWEWGPAKYDSTDPRNPEALAGILDVLVARAGRPDDN
jgi:hypothetical protein